jgi:hypothetical protein
VGRRTPKESKTRKAKYLAFTGALAISAALSGGAQATGFINGGFEDGNAGGWTIGGGVHNGYVPNSVLNPTAFLPGGALYNASIASSHSAIISAGATDPRVGTAFGTTVYSGNYSWRIEDTTAGGYASVLSQRVNNYTDSDIFFAWKAVLEGAHGVDDAATMIINLTDLTTSTNLIMRQYNAASGGGGVDSRFSFSSSSNLYYTPNWQIEQLSIGPGLLGHDFLLTILASDCTPTAHLGYAYIDGFGAVTPPPVVPATGVPEPMSAALLGAGLLGLGLLRRSAAARREEIVALLED